MWVVRNGDKQVQAPGILVFKRRKMPLYSPEWFKKQQIAARRSAEQIVPILMEEFSPRNVIDVGCGVGVWLAVFREHGIAEVWGIDGTYVDLSLLKIPPDRFFPCDLTQPFQMDGRFDLVLSLEVAEHLPARSAEIFVDSLTRLGDVIVFSAAVPLQGGTGHVNEQWPEYWVQLFHQRGYMVVDCLRSRIWKNEQVDWWYAQNMLLFVTPDYFAHHPALQDEQKQNNLFTLPLVHPRMFSSRRYDFRNIRLKEALSAVPVGMKNSIRGRLRRYQLAFYRVRKRFKRVSG
jgi:SAM-dependent methyltransferase